ncbi:MAG: WD40/YVTN/BNR-like repeat-containing protein [Candidatus Acidiferrales bacterium]
MKQALSHRNLMVLVVLLFLALSARAQGWRQVGPPGGDVESLAAVPGSARTLFLGTSDGHIFGSRDAGEHWELLGRIGEHHDDVIMSMVVDSRSADTLYASSWTLLSHGGGVYRSVDGGHTWQRIGLAGLVVRAIAQAPSNPDILLAGATDGVYRSEDSGIHWARISPLNR